MRHVLLAAVVAGCPIAGSHAQEAVRLAERFDPADATHVEVKVSLAGRLAIPDEKGQPRAAPVAGTSALSYDERPLARDRTADKVLRLYQAVKFERTVDGRPETADLRPAVRRVVVQRSQEGRKAPFSPDGPLTAGELDVIRTDLFSPALVPGLLPEREVRPGDKWKASPAAVADLTDFDPVDGGELTVTFVGVVTPDGRRLAKLTVAGTVTGRSEDGPARQLFDGVAYFDLRANRLSYLNLAGTQQLLADDKQVTGEVRGTLVVTRGPVARPLDIGETPRESAATETNTELLFDEPALGLRFLYPRRWKAGPPKGRQITLDEPNGGGLLITLEAAGKAPTADAFRRETLDFLKQQKWPAGEASAVRKVGPLERFGLDAEANGQRVRLEYAVLTGPDGGATVAARLPWADREARGREVERVLATLTVGRPAK